MCLPKNYRFLKLVKILKKSLILNLFVFLSVSFLYAENALYIYKNKKGNVFFTNIRSVNLSKDFKKIKVIKIHSNIVKNSKYNGYSRYSEYSKYKIGNLLKKAAQKYNIDYNLLKAVAITESNMNHKALSHKGAIGIMQLMPETAKRFGVHNLNNVEENIAGGAKYLKFLLKEFHGNSKLALAAYNAGENSIKRYNGVPPFPETKKYLRKVFTLYRQFLNNEKFF